MREFKRHIEKHCKNGDAMGFDRLQVGDHAALQSDPDPDRNPDRNLDPALDLQKHYFCFADVFDEGLPQNQEANQRPEDN